MMNVFLKIIGSKLAIKLALITLRHLAKKSDNVLDDELVDVVEDALKAGGAV